MADHDRRLLRTLAVQRLEQTGHMVFLPACSAKWRTFLFYAVSSIRLDDRLYIMEFSARRMASGNSVVLLPCSAPEITQYAAKGT